MPPLNLVVTGAARGIGRAVVQAALDRGLRVHACVRALSPELPAGASWRAVDVRDPDAVAAWLDDVGREAPIEALLNNAAVLGPRRSLRETTAQDVREALDTNVVGAFNVARAALPHMARGGRMLHVSSYLGRHALPDYGAYCLSKFGLEALARMVAVEHPELISAALDPGMVQTDMLRAARRGSDISDATDVHAAAQRILTLLQCLSPEASGTTVSL